MSWWISLGIYLCALVHIYVRISRKSCYLWTRLSNPRGPVLEWRCSPLKQTREDCSPCRGAPPEHVGPCISFSPWQEDKPRTQRAASLPSGAFLAALPVPLACLSRCRLRTSLFIHSVSPAPSLSVACLLRCLLPAGSSPPSRTPGSWTGSMASACSALSWRTSQVPAPVPCTCDFVFSFL